MSAPAMSAPLTPPTCAKPSRGYITERKVQARGAAAARDGAAAARGATAKKPVTRYDAPYTTEDGKPLGHYDDSIGKWVGEPLWQRITCPALAALVKNGDLVPDPQTGHITQKQCRCAFAKIGVKDVGAAATATNFNFLGWNEPANWKHAGFPGSWGEEWQGNKWKGPRKSAAEDRADGMVPNGQPVCGTKDGKEYTQDEVDAFNDELHINVYFMNVTNKQWYTNSTCLKTALNCCTLEPQGIVNPNPYNNMEHSKSTGIRDFRLKTGGFAGFWNCVLSAFPFKEQFCGENTCQIKRDITPSKQQMNEFLNFAFQSQENGDAKKAPAYNAPCTSRLGFFFNRCGANCLNGKPPADAVLHHTWNPNFLQRETPEVDNAVHWFNIDNLQTLQSCYAEITNDRFPGPKQIEYLKGGEKDNQIVPGQFAKRPADDGNLEAAVKALFVEFGYPADQCESIHSAPPKNADEARARSWTMPVEEWRALWIDSEYPKAVQDRKQKAKAGECPFRAKPAASFVPVPDQPWLKRSTEDPDVYLRHGEKFPVRLPSTAPAA